MTQRQRSIQVIFGDVVDRVRANILAQLIAARPNIETINYQYGNLLELQSTLTLKGASPVSNRSYPAIFLLEDIDFKRTKGYLGEAVLQVFICCITKANYTTQEREVKTFDPILRPIYYELVRQMARQPEFVIYNENTLKHKPIERKYWGVSESAKNAFGEYVDAIEMQNVTFNVNYKYCGYGVALT